MARPAPRQHKVVRVDVALLDLELALEVVRLQDPNAPMIWLGAPDDVLTLKEGIGSIITEVIQTVLPRHQM